MRADVRRLAAPRPRRARLAVAVAAAVVVGATQAGGATAPAAEPVPLSRLVGQRLVVAMQGTSPSDALLGRVRRGEVGGVILFGANVQSPAQVRRLIAALRAAAAAGDQPRPLVAVDQEGGIVRRLRWAPPTLSAAELAARPPSAALAQGRATGAALATVGIDLDLAPVADVPVDGSSFLVEQGRAYGTTPGAVAARASAFARGLRAAGIGAAAKHFPGLGRAGGNTDEGRVVVTASRGDLLADAAPFRRLAREGVPVVMLANAVYPALGPRPAAWENGVKRLLRRDLGFEGVTITDALPAAATAGGVTLGEAAVLAARSGTDLLLVTAGEGASAGVFSRLLRAARAGELRRASLERSHERILALKQALTP